VVGQRWPTRQRPGPPVRRRTSSEALPDRGPAGLLVGWASPAAVSPAIPSPVCYLITPRAVLLAPGSGPPSAGRRIAPRARGKPAGLSLGVGDGDSVPSEVASETVVLLGARPGVVAVPGRQALPAFRSGQYGFSPFGCRARCLDSEGAIPEPSTTSLSSFSTQEMGPLYFHQTPPVSAWPPKGAALLPPPRFRTRHRGEPRARFGRKRRKQCVSAVTASTDCGGILAVERGHARASPSAAPRDLCR